MIGPLHTEEYLEEQRKLAEARAYRQSRPHELQVAQKTARKAARRKRAERKRKQSSKRRNR